MKKLLAISLSVLMLLSIIPLGAITASAFSKDNFKAEIKEIHIGAPITGLDGKRYYPVDVHFTANENLSDSDMVNFLEGYVRAILKNETTAESVKGLGMTLMGPLKPDVPLENSNMWTWNWKDTAEGGGEGVIKYNVPILEEGETQAVEKNEGTGLTEVNGVKEGDKLTFQIETDVNTSQLPPDVVDEVFPDGPRVFSEEKTVTIPPEKILPYIVAYDTANEDETTEPETTEATEPETTDTTEQVTTEAVEPTTEQPTEEATTEAVEPTTEQPTEEATTEAVEPTTEQPTEEATTEAVEPTTEQPTEEATTEAVEPTTEQPTEQVTTEAVEPTTQASTQEAIVEPTTQPATSAEYETIEPTVPVIKPTQESTTEAPTQEAVITPTQPTTGSSAEAETTAPSKSETKPKNDSKAPISIKKANVTVRKGSVYNGKALKPAVTVTLDGNNLKSGVDFKVTYSNNKNAGKATAVVKGEGGYKDSVKVEFKIAKAKNSAKVKIKKVTVKAKKLKSKARKVATITVKKAKGKVSYKIIKKGTAKKIYKKLKISSNGVVKIKKWKKAPKGKYTVKVKITIKGTKNYKSKTYTKKIRIKIK